MIERLQRIAGVVQKMRWLWILLALAATVVVIGSVVGNPWLEDDRWLMPGVVALCWPLTLLSFGHMFETVPPRVSREMPWHYRLALKVHRGMLWMLGLVMIGLTGAVLLLSWQLLRVWSQS